MNEPYTETTRVMIGYGIGEVRERTQVTRTVEVDGKSPREAADAILLAAEGLIEPTVSIWSFHDMDIGLDVTGWRS